MENNRILYLMKRTWLYSAGRRRLFYGHIFLTIIANIFDILQPLALAKAFNAAQLSPNDPALLRNVIVYLLIAFGLWLAFRILYHISGLAESKNAFFVTFNFRKALVEKALALPAEWHQKHHSANTINKIERASSRLGSFSGSIYVLIENTIRAGGSIIVLAFFDWKASVVAGIICISTGIIVHFFDNRIVVTENISNRQESKLATVIQDSLSNITTIISLNLQPLISRHIISENMNLYPSDRRRAVLNAAKWSLAKLTMNVLTTTTIILYAVTSYNSHGIILVGTLFTLYKYLSNMVNIFNDSAGRYSKLVKEEIGVRGIEDLETAYENIASDVNASLPSNWKKLNISDLQFSYPASENGATLFRLENISLRIQRGQKVALVGESGGGKSTLLLLLRGLYQAHADVSVDSKKLPHGLAHLRPHATFIPQQPEIFDTTIEQNITMGIEYTPEELSRAIRLACLDEVIANLPEGMATHVMEKGVRLSGGQKQRLALARGLLASEQSHVLLLDEPTSSVDSLTESEIYKNIFSQLDGKTVISTLHSLHLLPLFDYIYFIDKGKIVGEGTLKELLQHNDFKKLWESVGQKESIYN